MKGAGWIGIVVLAVGALMIYAGYTNVDPLDVLRSILRNEPMDADELRKLKMRKKLKDSPAGVAPGVGNVEGIAV